MAFTLVSDALWNEIRPLLPKEAPEPQGGRPRVDDRACLTGIVYVLRTGMPWRFVPREHTRLLRALQRAGRIDPRFGIIDSQSVRAVLGASTPAPIPRIAGKKAANVT